MSARTLHARFPSRRQAESAVWKLRALRGDGFRLECPGFPVVTDRLSSARVEFATTLDAEVGAAAAFRDRADVSVKADQGCAYLLSAQIPDIVTMQAQRVIREAGGTIE